MSKLEELVPPWELCKLIPAGEFADTVLLWHEEDSPYGYFCKLFKRDGMRLYGFFYPAPTLQEIMAKLPPYAENEKVLACCVPDWADFNARVFGEHWRVGYTGDVSVNDKSPSTAALKLWLKLKGIEYEK